VRSEERKQHALETIERNATAQTQLIEDILDVSRIITGKLHLALSQVSLVQVIEMAIDAARPAAAAKNLEIESDLDLAIGTVTGDPERLQQVVWNLVSNAVKFSRPGGRIELALRRIDGEVVELEVKDSGEGIDPAFLPHIFERFRQAEASTTRVHGGLGLGLAIVRHIVELHGGTVSASSEGRGRGTKFVVRLRDKLLQANEPAADHSPRSERLERASLTTANADLTDVKVLVLEDDDDTRDLLVSILRQLGADVTAAPDAASGMALLLDLLPDVVVSDIGMPHEDGYSFIRRVRMLPPEQGGRTPAIALTAYAREQDRKRALEAGFDMYVPKPVDPVDLGVVVANVALRRRQS
jgi:CheY-like chemotaxis protein